MANPTSGFQLSALPQPLSMPSNLGKFDVGETQQAYANALKNTQQTALLGPQTNTAIAQAAYQKGLAEQQSRLLSPQEETLVNQYRQQQLEAQNAANVAQAIAPRVGPLAVKQQGLRESQTDVFGNRLAQGGNTGTSSVDLGGGVSMPVSVDLNTGAYTPMGGTAFASNLMNKPRGGIEYIANGPPRVAGNKTVRDYVAVQYNPVTGQPFPLKGVGAVTQDVNLPIPVWKGQGGSALGSFVEQAGAAAANDGSKVIADQGQESAIEKPVVGPDQVYVPFTKKVVDKDSEIAKAVPVIEKAVAGVDPNVVMNKDQEKRFTERIAQNSDNMNALSSQSLSLQNAKRAFDEVKKSGVIKTGPWWRVLSPDIAALFGEYQGQDFDSAMLSYVEKTTGTLKNLRAYQAVKDLLIGAKPKLTDDPRVSDAKFAYMSESLNHQQDYISAENYMLEKGVPYSTALSTASKIFRVSPDGDYNTWAAKKGIAPSATAEANKETAGAATNAPVQLPDTFTKEEFEKLVPVGATYTLKGKNYKRPK
jgi:hypothetical protein